MRCRFASIARAAEKGAPGMEKVLGRYTAGRRHIHSAQAPHSSPQPTTNHTGPLKLKDKLHTAKNRRPGFRTYSTWSCKELIALINVLRILLRWSRQIMPRLHLTVEFDAADNSQLSKLWKPDSGLHQREIATHNTQQSPSSQH